MDEDRFILLRDEPGRRRAGNAGTRILTAGEIGEALRGPVAPGAEEAFRAAWPTLRGRLAAARPGLLAVAVDQQGVAATVGVKARANRPVSAIVGRHAASDLYLPDDPTLSLRHIVLLVLPRADGPIRYRVLDLRSGRAFEDEHHRPVEALEADGPMVIHAGRYTVILFPVDEHASWPDDAREAWASVPPRTYQRQERERIRPRRTDTTAVQIVDGPSFVRLARGSEGRLGLLRVASSRGGSAFAIGERAARAGVLLGRYDRCDNAGLQVLDDPNVSRVHLLVIELDGTLYAIDTGSTNGVRHAGQPFRERALGAHDVLELGLGLAEVEWLASH